jgi:hypothetical protein
MLCLVFLGCATVPSSAPSSQAVSLSVSPSSGSYKAGDRVSLEIRLNTSGKNVVAVAAHLNFDPAKLEFVSIDSAGSAFSIKAEEVVSGKLVKISRGQATPGVKGSNILVGKINFKAKAAGPSRVDFMVTTLGKGPSRVILDDGKGTDILKAVSGGSYSIK